MALRTVALHPLAAREARAAWRWYARRSLAAAQRFRLAWDHVVQEIETAAEQGVPYGQSYRWMQLHRFPYLVYYEIDDPQPVFVYAVAHASHRPGYWLRPRRP